MSQEEERNEKKRLIRRTLEECIAGKGRYAIGVTLAREMLTAFEEVCESYDSEIEANGYEARAERERD